MKVFNLGSGSRLAAIQQLLVVWLRNHGVRPDQAPAYLSKLGCMYGPGLYKLDGGHLLRQTDGQWKVIVHRDDVGVWLTGVAVAVEVSEPPMGPPPVEPDYAEVEGGGYRCLHCDKEYKAGPRAEAYILKHLDIKHGVQ